jgi:hypothetical protein
MTCFFEYTCDLCGTEYCERISVMNLALDITEEGFCLACLSKQYSELTPENFYHWIYSYIESRDCFLSPWQQFAYQSCTRITDKSCFCQEAA